MALTVFENKEATGAKVKVDRRLCLDGKGKIVEADDRAAVALYASAGKSVSKADFEARGGELAVAKPEPEPETKAAPEVTEPKAVAKKVIKKKATKKKATTKKKTTKKKRS